MKAPSGMGGALSFQGPGLILHNGLESARGAAGASASRGTGGAEQWRA